MHKILIIEDDKDIAELEQDYLELNGYSVHVESDGQKGLDCALETTFDLIIVDLMLPSLTGFEVVKSIRKKQEVPMIIISARSEDIDKIRGLSNGADDYMTKPFSPAELLARVKTHISRYERFFGNRNDHLVEVKGLVIDKHARTVHFQEQEVILTAKEFDLLNFLASNPNHVFSKSQIYDRIWGEEDFGETATVAVHIQRIRKKVEKIANAPDIIETVWGAGYRMNSK